MIFDFLDYSKNPITLRKIKALSWKEGIDQPLAQLKESCLSSDFEVYQRANGEAAWLITVLIGKNRRKSVGLLKVSRDNDNNDGKAA